ncbi:MAG: acylphosphatase [Candidatus Coatesbacteria bacterium]|nr:MAG: acylphosphatase [Candidatus Coatesbacteria bacterium]
MADTVRRKLLLSGAVQGVGFRYWAVREAGKYAVAGYVRNLPDGRVEVVLEGPPEEVARLAGVMREGPPYGRVDHVETKEERPREDRSSFQVEF